MTTLVLRDCRDRDQPVARILARGVVHLNTPPTLHTSAKFRYLTRCPERQTLQNKAFASPCVVQRRVPGRLSIRWLRVRVPSASLTENKAQQAFSLLGFCRGRNCVEHVPQPGPTQDSELRPGVTHALRVARHRRATGIARRRLSHSLQLSTKKGSLPFFSIWLICACIDVG